MIPQNTGPDAYDHGAGRVIDDSSTQPGWQRREIENVEYNRYLMAASSRTFLLGLDRSTMVFDKRPGPMERENMHTFSFGAEEVEHLLNGTVPEPPPSFWEYRRANVVEKVVDRAKYGGEGIIVEFSAGHLEVPGHTYVYSDASPLMFGFTPGVARVSNIYRMVREDPLTIEAARVEDLLP